MIDITKVTLEDSASYTYDSYRKISLFFRYDSTDLAAVSENFDDANIYETDYGRIIGIEIELEIYPETHEYHLFASPTCQNQNGDVSDVDWVDIDDIDTINALLAIAGEPTI